MSSVSRQNDISFKKVGPNQYIRKGPIPGSNQAGAIQFTKDVVNEIYGQVFPKLMTIVNYKKVLRIDYE